MDATDFARRINDNLHWSRVVGQDSSDEEADRPREVWPQIEALWDEPDEAFIAGLYLTLLGRAAEPEGMTAMRAALDAGMRRADAVRSVAESDEARAASLDVSWLSRLDAPPVERERPSFVSLLADFWRRAAARPRGLWSRAKARWRR